MTRSGQKPARETKVSAPKTPHLDLRKRKSGPGVPSERSRSARAPRTSQDDPFNKLPVDGIEVHGYETTF